MQYMHYLLEPLDVALFRDGRPFSPGEFLRAQPLGSVPMPRTIYGAFRGLILQHNGISLEDFKQGKIRDDLAEVLGTPDQPGALRICGPFLAILSDGSTELLLPWPADCVWIGSPGQGEWGFQRPTPKSAIGNYPKGLHPLVPHKYDTSRGGWVPCSAEDPVTYEMEASALWSSTLREYLQGQALELLKLREYVRTEPHVGIERSTETLRPETGKIYSVEFHRLAYRRPAAGDWRAESAAYAVQVLAPEDCLPEDTIFAVGGERRPFRIRRVPWRDWFGKPLRSKMADHLKSCWADGVCRFRLYLLTPARFRGPEGWRPEFEFRLVAAAVPRAIPYSGWDMSRGRPREGYRLAPAGSVYFFEACLNAEGAPEKLVESLMERFWLESIVDDKSDAKMGFGLTLIGGWSYAG